MTRGQLAAGVLYGVAIGDSLGAATEFISHDQIVARFGPEGPSRPGPTVTDDTQLTLAVAWALLETPRPFSPAALEAALRRRLVEWNESAENDRAPGTSCVRASLSLATGCDWLEATAINSKGCGANMRVAPVGLLNFDYDGVTSSLRGAIAQFQAVLTHGHPTALAASDLTAAAVADLSAGGDPAGLCERLREYARSQQTVYHERWLGRLWERPEFASPQDFIRLGWQQCLSALNWVEDALALDTQPSDPCTVCGEGWVAEEALACALFCFLLHPKDPVRAVRLAATSGGDSDSIAAITGALAGAHRGIDAWPAEWVQQVEYSQQIAELVRAWE
ncbi:MAG: ADP-ribosylglycohydrolase family protein [Phycisphaerae bacterium]|nr:ADP-ribosylglycohydrolase family protein [Phycisphaerae bacterium]MDW8261977.1 ADP-ribosylglycohydrolase family protein [Phycisphaerales bacterium]